MVKVLPNTSFLPVPKSAPAGHTTAAAHLLWQVFPRYPCLEYKDNSGQSCPVRYTWTASFGPGLIFWQKWFNLTPQFVAYQLPGHLLHPHRYFTAYSSICQVLLGALRGNPFLRAVARQKSPWLRCPVFAARAEATLAKIRPLPLLRFGCFVRWTRSAPQSLISPFWTKCSAEPRTRPCGLAHSLRCISLVVSRPYAHVIRAGLFNNLKRVLCDTLKLPDFFILGVDNRPQPEYNNQRRQRAGHKTESDGDLHSGSAVDSDSTCGSSILSSPTRSLVQLDKAFLLCWAHGRAGQRRLQQQNPNSPDACASGLLGSMCFRRSCLA